MQAGNRLCLCSQESHGLGGLACESVYIYIICVYVCIYIYTHIRIHMYTFIYNNITIYGGFPDGSVGKESTCNAEDTGDLGSIPGSGRPLGEGNGNLLHYSCLENPMDRGAWWATVDGVAKSRTQLND